MDNRIIKPLTQAHWSQTLETLMDWMDLDDTLSDGVVIRRFMDVVARAPHPHLVEGMGKLDAHTIEGLLAAGACDALAMRLIGEDSGFFASRGPGGDYLVSVVLAGHRPEMTAAGTTLPRAIVNVLALILSQPDAVDGAPVEHVPVEHSYAGMPAATTVGATLH